MYKQLGYSVYRTVIEYYSASNGEPDEDAYGKSRKLFIFYLSKLNVGGEHMAHLQLLFKIYDFNYIHPDP